MTKVYKEIVVTFDMDDVEEFIGYASEHEKDQMRNLLGIKKPELKLYYSDRSNLIDIINGNNGTEDTIDQIVDYIKTLL